MAGVRAAEQFAGQLPVAEPYGLDGVHLQVAQGQQPAGNGESTASAASGLRTSGPIAAGASLPPSTVGSLRPPWSQDRQKSTEGV
ncbi:hypothetical protein CQW39_35270 [Streptomyces griseofuscus]|uniref:hypothetical protein n=1 Tax=Streptomyces griseofuscus TaxID=146922 RepID=UPI000F64DB60|nr:hypothetical protein [Streptomyces griseofuscus]RRQ69721.1 hypothetical protein CQW39_35270 [Streptomyces griseofuscus]